MKVSSHSEYGKIQSIFIKTAHDAFVDREKVAHEWQLLNFLEPPDFLKALSEYQTFEGLLQQTQSSINYFPKQDSLTLDSIYCRDASIATDYGMIICRMGKDSRQAEPKAQQDFFETKGTKILGTIQSPGTVEGGDIAWLDEQTLAIGHTYRTNEAGIQQVKNWLNPHGIEVIKVDLPHYKGTSDVFHLMSILSPVDKDLAVVYSPLMPIAFRNILLSKGFGLIEVPEDEFETMGCNVLALAPRKCVIVKGNPKTKRLLENAGCEVFEYEGKEISVKGGGGPTCLTRPWQRIL